eukprot:GGOE01044612.1.p1 GENE.GGOE01044612.1~~GGOE01044612.1.p1  ORF type:complete len:604 (+),score=152.01 GGOE01044612.1:100-1911(+)
MAPYVALLLALLFTLVLCFLALRNRNVSRRGATPVAHTFLSPSNSSPATPAAVAPVHGDFLLKALPVWMTPVTPIEGKRKALKAILDEEIDNFSDLGRFHLGFHWRGHEDGVVMGTMGTPHMVAVEMAKVTRIPFIHTSPLAEEVHQRYWNQTQHRLYSYLDAVGQHFPHFDALASDAMPEALCWRLISRRFPHRRRFHQNHHEAHATHAFYSSPFNRAVVVTADGSGNDGNFNIFLAQRGNTSLRRLYMKKDASYGVTYRYLSGIPQTPHQGAFMAYAAMGTVRANWTVRVDKIFRVKRYTQQIALSRRLAAQVTPADSKDYAATVQHVLQEAVHGRIVKYMEALRQVDGVALSGGVTHNVRLNSYLRRRLTVPVHVPPNPGDGGTALGNLLRIQRPLQPADYRFLGLPLEDLDRMPEYTAQWQPSRPSDGELAQLLGRGALVGVLWGRQEYGETSFGHRSVLAAVTNATVKARVLKWMGARDYQYVQVALPLEVTPNWFGSLEPSPYASFAPRLTPALCRQMTVCLADHSLHLQTVTAEADPWLHRLLLEVRRRTGFPALIVAGLRPPGQTLTNRIDEALGFLRNGTLDHLLVEGQLFSHV